MSAADISTNHGGSMGVIMQSTRFGEIEISPESVLEFPTGLIGLGGSRYALLARSEDAAFIWLHSLDDPDLAIPVTNPWRFFTDYEVELSDEEADRIGISAADQTSVYVTVRAAAVLEDFCANLRAPILVAHGQGHQIINQAPDSPVRAPLFQGIAEPTSSKVA
jgi:flagellar assembly factor FliW